MTEIDFSAAFRRFLAEKSQHFTRQRALIVETFIGAKTHVSIEELYGLVRLTDPSVGQVTVFRTIKLLEEAGLVQAVSLGGKSVRYELYYKREHHDHLVCSKCGAVLEVLDTKLEKRKEKICAKHDFKPTHHRLEIFGICKVCR